MNKKKLTTLIANAVITKTYAEKKIKAGKKENIEDKKIKMELPAKGVVEICDSILGIGSLLHDMMPDCYGNNCKKFIKTNMSLCIRCCWLTACRKERQE